MFLHAKVSLNVSSRKYSVLKRKERIGRRVVVTGLGLVTPIGTGVAESWKNLLQGKSGIRRITHFDTSSLPSKIAASINIQNFGNEKQNQPEALANFDYDHWIPKEIKSQITPFIAFAISAAKQAIEDSKYKAITEAQRERSVRIRIVKLINKGSCYWSWNGSSK
jgi:3-oxoacyl-[acyl-carrier-protein] synthase II